MCRVKLLLILLSSLLFSIQQASATDISDPDTTFLSDSLEGSGYDSLILLSGNQYVVTLTAADSLKTSKYKSKKRIAAILAFPFPFGLLGLHRVFLGTKPYIPFVYIGTLGGCFLVLPIIDFIAILTSNEESFKQFENNSKVFMWSH